MMKSLYKYMCFCLLAGLVSCSDEEPLVGQTEGQKITATAIGSEGESVFSRLGYQDEQNGGVTITWAEGDQFYMKGSNGASATMAILDGVGEKTARFTGTLTGGSMTDEESVSAYYPAAAYDAENDCFHVDLREIEQDCTSGHEMNHLGATYFMIGSGKNYGGDAEVSFVGGTKVAMLRFDLTLPKQVTSNLTIDELQIVCDDLKTLGTLAADGTFTTDEFEESHRQKVVLHNLPASTTVDTKFCVYVNVLPTKITGKMRLKVMLSDETVYWCDVDLTNVELEANNRYYLVRGFLEQQKVEVDYSWYHATNTPLTISNEAQLRALVHIVNGTYPKGTVNGYDRFKGQTIQLVNDIDLIVDWTPIGTYAGGTYYFRGTFDGQGHKINNLFYQDYGQKVKDIRAVGLFGVTEGATIRNLTVGGFIKTAIRVHDYVGGIVGRNIYNTSEKKSSLFMNCRNEVDVLSDCTSDSYTGGIAGYVRQTSLVNCSNSGHISHSKGRIGGIAGGFRGKEVVMACVNEGILESSYLENDCIGGIIGRFYEDTYTVSMIANYSIWSGVEMGKADVGGIAGYIKASGSSIPKVNMYGSYTLYSSFFGIKDNNTIIDEKSCLLLTQDNENSQGQADLLNAGILKWNEKEDGVNGDVTHDQYCNYHFEVGETHLIIKEGAPTAPAGAEEQ